LTRRGWTFQERYLARRILHFSLGGVLFECNKLMASDHDNGQIGQEYGVRQVIRFDGRLHSAASCAIARAHISPTMFAMSEPTKIWSQEGGGEYKTYARWVDNPRYKEQQDTIKALISTSARLGMRGTFDFLWRFSGAHDWAEAAEFHNGWYEMIESYSSRDLTRPEDKLMAISGVAYFIQKNTVQYNSGLWEEIMPFNMLWTVSGKPKSRPSRPIPTWSWASVDGKISHRLKGVAPAKSQFRSTWISIVDRLPKDTQKIVKDTVNGLVLNSRLKMTCNLWSFSHRKVNVIWDIPAPSVDSLFILPILSFQNPEIHPLKSEIQLHGIILREKLEETLENTFERVGYFWTADKNVVHEFSEDNNKNFHRRAIEMV
jgi:hypothetical protein